MRGEGRIFPTLEKRPISRSTVDLTKNLGVAICSLPHEVVARLAVLGAVLIVAALTWFIALTLTVYAEVGGPARCRRRKTTRA
jgi:hypothetical protein